MMIMLGLSKLTDESAESFNKDSPQKEFIKRLQEIERSQLESVHLFLLEISQERTQAAKLCLVLNLYLQMVLPDVLEVLNQLLNDNRELFLPELRETIPARPDFMFFATQNPPILYGGCKMLS